MKKIEWKTGIENNFSVSVKQVWQKIFYKKILETYSNFKIVENWKSLFVMVDIFKQTSNQIADELGFKINKSAQDRTIEYLKQEHERHSWPQERSAHHE